MPRRNIYVDDELEEQLKGLDVPVSQVCQDALRQAVQRALAVGLSDASLAAAAQRLLADKAADDQHWFEEGLRIGSSWAKETATWTELRLLEPRNGRHRESVMLDESHSLRGALFSWVINSGGDVDESMFQVIDRADPFERGVIDGATSVLVAVLPVVEPRDAE